MSRVAGPAALALALLLAAISGPPAWAVFGHPGSVGGNTITTGRWKHVALDLEAAADAHIRSNAPNRNAGAETALVLHRVQTHRILVRFDSVALRSATQGKRLTGAKLRLYVGNNSQSWPTPGGEVAVHRVIEPWTEQGVTWNCPDDAIPGNNRVDCPVQWGGGAFAPIPTDVVLHTNSLSGWVEWDVTADLVDMLAAPETNHGWLVKKADEDVRGRASYASREAVSNPPELKLIFVEPE